MKHLHGGVCTFFRDAICSLKICVVHMKSFSTVFERVFERVFESNENVMQPRP